MINVGDNCDIANVFSFFQVFQLPLASDLTSVVCLMYTSYYFTIINRAMLLILAIF